MALLAVWKSGQPIELSTATSSAICQISRTKAKPTNHNTPEQDARMIIARRPNRSVIFPPRNWSGIIAAGTRPKTIPIQVIDTPSSRCM